MGTTWRDPSFEAFIGRASPQLLRTAYLLSGDSVQADDLVQMTLVRVGRRWAAAQAAPEAYAHRVLANLLHDWRRGRARRVSERPLGEHHQPSAADHAAAVIDHDALMQALARLPARQREVLVLRFYADLSVEQTAAAIGASTGSVKTHTSRALGRLRELMADQTPRTEVPSAER